MIARVVKPSGPLKNVTRSRFAAVKLAADVGRGRSSPRAPKAIGGGDLSDAATPINSKRLLPPPPPTATNAHGKDAVDRSWDGFEEEGDDGASISKGKKNNDDGGHACEFSLSALVGMATLVGEERARVEAERAQTLETLTDAIKAAAQREVKVLSDVVDRLRKGGSGPPV